MSPWPPAIPTAYLGSGMIAPITGALSGGLLCEAERGALVMGWTRLSPFLLGFGLLFLALPESFLGNSDRLQGICKAPEIVCKKRRFCQGKRAGSFSQILEGVQEQ